MQLGWQSACLPLMKHYWPQSPPLHKPGVVAHTCPRIQEVDSTQHIPSQPGLSNEILSQKKKQEEEEKEEDEEEEEEEEEREEEEQRQQEWRLYLAYQALCGLGCVAASQNKQAGFFFLPQFFFFFFFARQGFKCPPFSHRIAITSQINK